MKIPSLQAIRDWANSKFQLKGNYLTEETDPTVPAWAKEAQKPTYTASEVGALPADTQIPSKVSDLTNDSKFQTESEVSQTVADAVGDITSFDYKVVDTLPASGVKGTIYLVPSTEAGDKNVYSEYLWINNAWELIGSTKVDLSDYTKTVDLAPVALSNKSSDLNNDAGFLTEYTETDPTVPNWAKEPSKPSYTADEVGALPSTTIIPKADGTTIIESEDGTLTAIGGGGGSDVEVNPIVTSGDKIAEITVDGAKSDIYAPTEVVVSSSEPPADKTKVWFDTSVEQITGEELPFRFGIDENGNYGYYKVGADSVTPFSSGGGTDIPAGTMVVSPLFSPVVCKLEVIE